MRPLQGVKAILTPNEGAFVGDRVVDAVTGEVYVVTGYRAPEWPYEYVRFVRYKVEEEGS